MSNQLEMTETQVDILKKSNWADSEQTRKLKKEEEKEEEDKFPQIIKSTDKPCSSLETKETGNCTTAVVHCDAKKEPLNCDASSMEKANSLSWVDYTEDDEVFMEEDVTTFSPTCKKNLEQLDNDHRKIEEIEKTLKILNEKMNSLLTQKINRNDDDDNNSSSSPSVRNTFGHEIQMMLDLKNKTCYIYGDKRNYGYVVGNNRGNINFLASTYNVQIDVPRKSEASNKIRVSTKLSSMRDLTSGISRVCGYLSDAYQKK